MTTEKKNRPAIMIGMALSQREFIARAAVKSNTTVADFARLTLLSVAASTLGETAPVAPVNESRRGRASPFSAAAAAQGISVGEFMHRSALIAANINPDTVPYRPRAGGKRKPAAAPAPATTPAAETVSTPIAAPAVEHAQAAPVENPLTGKGKGAKSKAA